MGIGAAFWAASGTTLLWHDMDGFNTSGSSLGGIDSDGRLQLRVGPCKIYQEPMVNGGRESRIQSNPGYDSGFFYALETTLGARLATDQVFLDGVAYTPGGGAFTGQWHKLLPPCAPGHIMPKSPNTVGIAAIEKSPIYKTGWLDVLGNAYQPGGSGQEVTLDVYVENVLGTWRLHHYSPWAWAGTIPEVIAAVAMAAGVHPDDINQDSFDNAFDAYDLITGDLPWRLLDDKWTVYARRTLGNKVSDFIAEIARHGRDFVFTDENGKLALGSRTRPNNSISGFDPATEGVLKTLSWESTLKHFHNSFRAIWGSAARQAWEDTNGFAGDTPASGEMSASFEPNLESNPNLDRWVDEMKDPGSVSKYGVKWLKGKKVLANTRGQPEEVSLASYPMLLTPHVNSSDPTVWDWDKDILGGGMVHLSHWLEGDATPKHLVEIRQDPRGFDLGVGDHLTNAELTGDGYVIPDAVIIERDYNFDSMQIDSVILENAQGTP